MSKSGTRILYVITDLEVGGVPLHIFRLALHVRDAGYQPTVISLKDGGPVASSLCEAGIPVESCHARGGWDVRVFKRLASLIAGQQPDIVHSFLFHANLASRWAAKSAGIPVDHVVCEIQTVEVERKWHLWVDRWTYDGCRFTIGNSPSVIEHLARFAHIPRDRLRLVRGGIDVARIDAAKQANKEELGLPHDVPIILWVGRLDPSKGLFQLVASFDAVQKKSKAHLVLVGDGQLREQLRHEIAKRNLQSSVHLLGSRNDVPSLLKIADLFVFPSMTEGLPNALLEAMAAGCAIVTTDVPGCRDLIENERTGLVVPYGDTQRLADAMLRLLNDARLARQFGSNAMQSVEANWRIDRMFAEYLSVYAEFTSPRGVCC